MRFAKIHELCLTVYSNRVRFKKPQPKIPILPKPNKQIGHKPNGKIFIIFEEKFAGFERLSEELTFL